MSGSVTLTYFEWIVVKFNLKRYHLPWHVLSRAKKRKRVPLLTLWKSQVALPSPETKEYCCSDVHIEVGDFRRFRFRFIVAFVRELVL